jgi:hypothetical protein
VIVVLARLPAFALKEQVANVRPTFHVRLLCSFPLAFGSGRAQAVASRFLEKSPLSFVRGDLNLNCFDSNMKNRDDPDSHSNDVGCGGGCLRRGGSPKLVRFDALSSEEWGYFLGMFLADGYAIRRTSKVRRAYAVVFSLQGDEMDIADRLTGMLRRLELKPQVMVGLRGEYKVNIRVHSKVLVMLLPDKRKLVEDVAYNERFLEEWKLFTADIAVAFIAGLLDGDGSCSVDDCRARLGSLRGSGISKWTWTFSQTKLPFLVDYIVRFLGSIAPNSVNVYERVKRGGRRSYEVRFHKSASIALLEKGIAKYSFKVARWERKVAKLSKRWESERLCTVNEVARMANVSWHVVEKWIRNGKLKYLRKERREKAGGSGGRHFWYFISAGEAKRGVKRLRRMNDRVKRIRREGAVSFVDACKTLGIDHGTLYKQYRAGRVRAIMVHEIGRASLSNYLVIPKKEMERLRKKYKHSERKQRCGAGVLPAQLDENHKANASGRGH